MIPKKRHQTEYKVQREIDKQREITQEFSQNSQQLISDINRKKDKLKADRDNGKLSEQEYQNQVSNLDKLNVLIGMIAGGLSAPTNSLGGIAAATVSPALAYEIGQYFKENNTEGSTAHLLAHAALGAAVAAAGGNNALVGAVSAAGGEAAAPALAHWLYGKVPTDLTADEKQTISSIVGLAGAAVGASTGNTADVASGFQAGQNAVNNNDFLQSFSPAIAAMLSKDSERRKALQLVSQIRTGNEKITLAIYGGSIAVVGGGMVAAEAGAAIYSACIANPGTCTVVGVDSMDTIVGLITGAVTINTLVPGQVVSRGKQALEQLANKGRPIIFENGYYKADGMMISEYYYNKLWNKGRPAPFLQVKEILNSNPKILPDSKPGFNRYEGAGLELIYNPHTGEIWHIQPIKK